MYIISHFQWHSSQVRDIKNLNSFEKNIAQISI